MKRCARIAVGCLFFIAWLKIPARAAEITFTKQSSHFQLSWPSDSPAWRLQYTTNLSAQNWITLTNFSISNSIYSVIETNAANSRFYRLYQEPASMDQPPVPVIWNEDVQPVLDGRTVLTNEGSQDLLIDASESTDPRGGTLDYHWVITTPNTVGYACRGITGYHSPVLSIEADSIPDYAPQTVTITLTLTHEPFDPYATTSQSTTVSYRTLYRNSALTVSMSTTCLNCSDTNNPSSCGCDAPQALPPFDTR